MIAIASCLQFSTSVAQFDLFYISGRIVYAQYYHDTSYLRLVSVVSSFPFRQRNSAAATMFRIDYSAGERLVFIRAAAGRKYASRSALLLQCRLKNSVMTPADKRAAFCYFRAYISFHVGMINDHLLFAISRTCLYADAANLEGFYGLTYRRRF